MKSHVVGLREPAAEYVAVPDGLDLLEALQVLLEEVLALVNQTRVSGALPKVLLWQRRQHVAAKLVGQLGIVGEVDASMEERGTCVSSSWNCL